MDFIHQGKASGVVAARLLASNFDVNSLRTNDTLLYDEWKHIDAAVIKAAQERLVGIADLQTRGLTYSVPEGLGKTVIAYQDQSDVDDASLSMDGITRGERDRPEYDINYMPLPIIHKDFSFSAREIQASRQGSMPLDTSMAELAARKVAEMAESLLFQGSGDYTFGGGTIQGYEDFDFRNSVTLGTNWDASAATGATILADVLAMKQASIDDRYYGPWVLYIPTAYETKLDDDFKAATDKSIRSRIMEVSGLLDIKVADFLTANNVIMVQMTSDVVRVVEALPITTVQWDSDGGMQVNFKVMTILVPQLRADQTDKCGIIHLAA